MSDVNHCGECGLCCRLLSIPELKKPQGQWCPQIKHGNNNAKSCGIYAERPGSCRSFQCLWLVTQSRLGQQMQPEMRPDRSHVVLVMDVFATHDISRTQRILFAHCDPKYPNAWRRGLTKTAIDNFGKRGGTVVVLIGRQRIVLQPGMPPVRGTEDDISVKMAEIQALLPASPDPMAGLPPPTFDFEELRRRRA